MMPVMRARSLGLVFALALGCGDDVTSSDDDDGSTSGTSSSDSMDPSSSGTDGTTTPGTTSSTTDADASSSSEGGFEPADPVCGNGFVEGEEECDDANDDDEDGCASCRLRCGLDWTAVALPPTDTSNMEAFDIAVDGNGGATLAGFLREVITDQRGNETILDNEGIVVRVDADGETVWEVRLAEEGVDIDVVSVADDGSGNVFVAASVGLPGEQTDIRLYRLDADGGVVWSEDFDSAVDSSDDFAFGVAIGADGNPVVSGQVRVAEGDDDVWLGSFDADDGTLLWSSTWSGAASGGFSNDDGGPVAVGDDGTVYVFAREYVDFQTQVATLLSFDGAGGEGSVVFQTNFGAGAQNQIPEDIVVEPDGSVMVVYIRVLASQNEYFVVRLDPADGSELWSVDGTTIAEAVAAENTEAYIIEGVDALAAGGVAIVGTFERSGDDATWVETWLARYGADDTLDCLFVRESPLLSVVPGSLRGRAVAASADGRAVVGALEVEDGISSLWIGAFRPN